jgi:Fur family transcriptional regulator, ferric uptake regulator
MMRMMRVFATNSPLSDDGIARGLSVLRAHVKKLGLKSSVTRDAVAKAALERVGHFTVEDLITDIRKDSTLDVHPATVYRILPLLLDACLIQHSLLANATGARYERLFEREHHDHLICIRCGKVVEFEFEAIELLQRDVAERLGFRLTEHVLELMGECASCTRHEESR